MNYHPIPDASKTRRPIATLPCRGYGRAPHLTCMYRRAGLCSACYLRALHSGNGDAALREWAEMKGRG